MAKVLVAYFTISGNTKKIAEKIAAQVGDSLYEIKTKTPYPNDYHAVVEQAKKELAASARPELDKPLPDISGEDVVIVGFPNWCSTLPMPVFTFLEGLDLNGKKVIPFLTHGGGGIGNADSDLKKICKGAEVAPCADGNKFDDESLQEWLQSNNLG